MRIKQAITANIGKLGECAKFENEYIKQTYQRSDRWVIWKAQPTHICEPLWARILTNIHTNENTKLSINIIVDNNNKLFKQ